jgi:hypothetical protein
VTGPAHKAKVTPAQEEVSAGPRPTAEKKVSVKKRRVSANPKPKRAKAKVLAENFPGLQLNVDDRALFELISAGRVGVHKNGSRQNRGGTAYDYRSHYRALRLNSGSREVLAFGTPARLTEKLAQLGITVCFNHRRPVLTVGTRCRNCGAGQGTLISDRA